MTLRPVIILKASKKQGLSSRQMVLPLVHQRKSMCRPKTSILPHRCKSAPISLFMTLCVEINQLSVRHCLEFATLKLTSRWLARCSKVVVHLEVIGFLRQGATQPKNITAPSAMIQPKIKIALCTTGTNTASKTKSLSESSLMQQ